jgi:hypothetical protein
MATEARRRARARAICLAAAVVAGMAQSVFPATTALAAPASFETNVSDDPSTNSGEPTIAVDPTNPRRLIITYTQVSLQQQLTHGQTPAIKDLEGETHCGYAFSTDRGRTWQSAPLPVTDLVQSSCADPFVVFDAHGTAYAAAGTYDPSIMVGGVRVIRSTDGGRTWSEPVQPISTLSGLENAPPGTTTYVGPSQTIDRTWLAFDDSTRTLYLSSRDFGGIRGHRYLVTSADGGRTWGRMRTTDSATSPEGDGPITAANGEFAVAYGPPRAPSVPSGCSCLVLAVTKNGGRTFTHRPAPFAASNQPTVVADPTHPGRYAVLIVGASATTLEMRITNDSGRTWRRPVVFRAPAAATFSRPWLAYSPLGVLGVMWRTRHADGSTDVFVTVARDGLRRFERPVRVNHATSPPPAGSELGDDFSHVTFDDAFVHVGWGDWRSGHMDAWYARLPLPARATA